MKHHTIAAALTLACATNAWSQTVTDGNYQFVPGGNGAPGNTYGTPAFRVSNNGATVSGHPGAIVESHAGGCAGTHVHDTFNNLGDPAAAACGHGIIAAVPAAVIPGAGSALPGTVPGSAAGILGAGSARPGTVPGSAAGILDLTRAGDFFLVAIAGLDGFRLIDDDASGKWVDEAALLIAYDRDRAMREATDRSFVPPPESLVDDLSDPADEKAKAADARQAADEAKAAAESADEAGRAERAAANRADAANRAAEKRAAERGARAAIAYEAAQAAFSAAIDVANRAADAEDAAKERAARNPGDAAAAAAARQAADETKAAIDRLAAADAAANTAFAAATAAAAREDNTRARIAAERAAAELAKEAKVEGARQNEFVGNIFANAFSASTNAAAGAPRIVAPLPITVRPDGIRF